MSTRGPIDVLRRRWSSVVATALVGLLAAVLYVAGATETYRASASVFFSLSSGNSSTDLVQGSN